MKFKYIFANCFIVLNLLIMLRTPLNVDNLPLVRFLYTPVNFVQSLFSMYQDWLMFAPNPLRTNFYMDALVEFEDEEEKIEWRFPMPAHDNHFARYVWGERFRKFSTDGVRKNENSHLWEDAAKFAAKKIGTTNKKKISRIYLRRHWNEIPHVNDQFIPHRTVPASYNTYTFYIYEPEGRL
jgi:hypothetical protein